MEIYKKILVKLDITPTGIKKILDKRISKKAVKPELIKLNQVRAPQAYKRLSNIKENEKFRQTLLDKLYKKWKNDSNENLAFDTKNKFIEMANTIIKNGAINFRSFIDDNSFQALVKNFDNIIENYGNKSLFHSYVDLGEQKEFLSNKGYNSLFIHPLLISLISYVMGGPVRLVDARAKDTQPIKIQAQDNILHIDNTPFNDEYKILITWEKGKINGSKGQNFVYIPGTNQGARNCFITKKGTIWSTENASIFITNRDIEKIITFQKHLGFEKAPLVIEIKNEESPVTSLFSAGSLVHHRYRSEEGSTRSCIILAFHKSEDNAGELIEKRTNKNSENLEEMIYGFQNGSEKDTFIKLILSNSKEIVNKIKEIDEKNKIINQEEKAMNKEELKIWKDSVTNAPRVEDLKAKLNFPLNKEIDFDEFLNLIVNNMMYYDKSGLIDLILYADNREEIRKWARKRIRELKVENMKLKLKKWYKYIQQPNTKNLLEPKEIVKIGKGLIKFIDNLPYCKLRRAKAPPRLTAHSL